MANWQDPNAGNYDSYGNYGYNNTDGSYANYGDNSGYNTNEMYYGNDNYAFDPNNQSYYTQQQPQEQQYYQPSPVPQQLPQQEQQQGWSDSQGSSSVAPPMSGGMSEVYNYASGMNPLVANMAMQMGNDFVGKGGQELKKNIDKYVELGQLKYSFAVDTSYVAKKLSLLLFPYTHRDWSLQYNESSAVQPRLDVNATDLYIPLMAFVTYILLVGYILGLQNAFSPDHLASTASSSLVAVLLEMAAIYLTLYLMNITTSLVKWDVLAFSTYKYVGVVFILLTVLLSPSLYHLGLVYAAAAIAFFLVRALKLRIEPEVHGLQQHGKRKLYVILFYAALQPLLMWFMTFRLVPSSPIEVNDNYSPQP